MFGNVRDVSGRFSANLHSILIPHCVLRHLRCILLRLVLCDILAEQDYLEPEHFESNER